MRPISLHVEDDDYRAFQELARERGVSVAALIRESMREHLEEARRRASRPSLRDLAPLAGGPLLGAFRRDEIYDEMVDPAFEVHEPSSGHSGEHSGER